MCFLYCSWTRRFIIHSCLLLWHSWELRSSTPFHFAQDYVLFLTFGSFSTSSKLLLPPSPWAQPSETIFGRILTVATVHERHRPTIPVVTLSGTECSRKVSLFGVVQVFCEVLTNTEILFIRVCCFGIHGSFAVRVRFTSLPWRIFSVRFRSKPAID